MNYDTFVNASFFLQGKADQFTQQPTGSRKRILGSILGLDIWEEYRQRAGERRKEVENEINGLDGRLAEIDAELGEEEARRVRLEELESGLKRLGKQRHAQEEALVSIRKVAAALAEQRRLVDALSRQADAARRRQDETGSRLQERRQERTGYTEKLAHQDEIEAAYKAWQQARADIEYWDEIASRFREQEKRRQAPLAKIQAGRARLEQELSTLEAQALQIASLSNQIAPLEEQLGENRQRLAQLKEKLSERTACDAELGLARQQRAEMQAENPRLKKEMDELKERIDQLEGGEGAECPLCGQPLGPDEREALIKDLGAQGKEMGDRFRKNLNDLKEIEQVTRELEAQLAGLGHVEKEHLRLSQAVVQLETRLERPAGPANRVGNRRRTAAG